MADRTCVIESCACKHYARGWCRHHYQQKWRAGQLNERPRVLVDPTADLDTRLRNIGWTVTERGCWEWKGSRNGRGYGQLAVGSTRPQLASRAAYTAWVGPIPDGLSVLHRCDNPPCINPFDLFVGTKAENSADCAAKQRTLNGERRPQSKLTDAEVDEIRALVANGLSQRMTAEIYGVTQGCVSMIVRRIRRPHRTYPAVA